VLDFYATVVHVKEARDFAPPRPTRLMNVPQGSAISQQSSLPSLLRHSDSEQYQEVSNNANRNVRSYPSHPSGIIAANGPSGPAEVQARYQNDFVIQSQSLQAIDPFNTSLPPLTTFDTGLSHHLLPSTFSEFSFAPTPPNGTPFDVLTPPRQLPSQSLDDFPVSDPFTSLGDGSFPEDPPEKNDAHLVGLKLIPNPPELEAWRERLFHIHETIVLTEEE
jgi:hypothetical protein